VAVFLDTPLFRALLNVLYTVSVLSTRCLRPSGGRVPAPTRRRLPACAYFSGSDTSWQRNPSCVLFSGLVVKALAGDTVFG